MDRNEKIEIENVRNHTENRFELDMDYSIIHLDQSNINDLNESIKSSLNFDNLNDNDEMVIILKVLFQMMIK